MLQSELRERSGFKGYIVSDCGAISWMGPTKHNYTRNDTESAAAGLNAGTDMDCGDHAYKHGIAPAIAAGLLSQATVDRALRCVLIYRYILNEFC